MKSQGRTLIDMLKRQPMTTMELLQTGISTCPWKRIKESLQEGEELVTLKNRQGLNVYRIKTAPKTVWVKKA